MPYKVAIIGAGKLGKTHARHWAAIPDVEVVAALDTHVGTDNQMGSAYTDWDQMLREARPDIIDICTPTPTHREYIELAAAAGKAVFVEKPLARTLEDCDKIVAAVERSGIPLMAGHVVRYFPAYLQAKQLIDSGTVGSVASIRASRLAGFPKRGTDPATAAESWYADPALSGGVILDAMLHDFDWILWCAGPITRVYAEGLHGRSDHPSLLDFALVTLRLANGAVAQLTGSWSYPGGFRTGFEIVGDNGAIEFDSARPDSLILTRSESPGGIESPIASRGDPYCLELRAFVDALTGGSISPVSVDAARDAVRVALAALKSIETGEPVTLH